MRTGWAVEKKKNFCTTHNGGRVLIMEKKKKCVCSQVPSNQTKTLLEWCWCRRSWAFMSTLKGPLLGGCTDGWWSAEASGQMTARPSCGKESSNNEGCRWEGLWRERARPGCVSGGQEFFFCSFSQCVQLFFFFFFCLLQTRAFNSSELSPPHLCLAR